MIRVSFTLAVLLIITIQSCDDDDGLDGELVAGKVSGLDWSFQYAKANFNASTNAFDVELFDVRETASDPCAVVSINAYIGMSIPNEPGTYNLPFTDPKYTLTFNQEGVGQEFFVANSGFVEIFSISGRRIGGYLQAYYDDENSVEGTFVFDRCN